MGHMQLEITHKQRGWEVATTHGTWVVPEVVQGVPTWLAPGVVITDEPDEPFVMLAALLRDYVEGVILSIEAVKPHYFARLSAPGYLDCTEWSMFKTIKEAREYLRDL